jgi:geranylgeranyl pyrophosphate synthase
MVNGDTTDPPAVAWQGSGASGAISITVSSPGVPAGEGIHPGSSIEWWFVHGTFAGPAVSARHFMISIFRYDLTRDKNASDDGYYVILSFLDPATGKQSVTSRGERRIIDDLFNREEEVRSTNLDRDLVTTYINEIRSYGPPAPVTLGDERPLAGHEPFSFSWNDLCFEVAGDGTIHLSGRSGEGCTFLFRLEPRSARCQMENIGVSPYRAMTYVTRPHLLLSGRMGTEPVSGTAWFDHQWGNSGWFLEKPGEGTLHGWDWAGISGSDGTNWIFLTFHDPETGSVLARHAFMLRKSGDVRTFTGFDARPTRFWTSPVTRIRYPVAMEILVPEAFARFVVEPVTDDQEIPVLGFMRAVWEGAATCSGTVAGLPFTGSARLELHGYGYIFDFRHYLAGHIERIRESIDDFIPRQFSQEDFRKFTDVPADISAIAALNETIVSPCRDLLSREKKYWRPVFALLLLEALGVRSTRYQQLLSVVPELTHTGTLIIDDIEDNAEVRRGDTCIHRRYGTDVAINAANTLYFLPSVLYGTHPDLTEKQKLEFYRITLDSFVRGHFGQAQDIWWTKNLTEKNLTAWIEDDLGGKILQMYELKTATAAIAMAEAGCILAGSDAKTRDACVSFARAFGTAFQIADDIQSFETVPGTSDVPCDDIAAGKVTYVIARALAFLAEDDKKGFIRILSSPKLRLLPESQNEGMDLVRKSGALEQCRAEAGAMMDDAWRIFSRVVPPSEAKLMLRLFSKNLIQSPKSGV